MFHGIEVFFTLAAVVGGPLLAVLVVPTLAKRFLRAASAPVERLPADPDDLRERAPEMEDLSRRVAELEGRLDFAERLLAQQRGAALPKPKA